jgi:hypothetical protein
MSLNQEYTEAQNAAVKQLVENSTFEKATNHAVFDASKLELPEDITPESMQAHVTYINQLSGQVEVATSQIARDQFADNNKLTTIDGTLDFGGFTINSQHHLKQQVGDDFLHGISSTAIDYYHSEEQTDWLQEHRDNATSLAAKLFG